MEKALVRVMRPVFGSMPSVVLTNDRRSAETIGYPIVSASTRSDGDSRIAASRPTPWRRPGGRPGSVVFAAVGAFVEVVVVTGGPPRDGGAGPGPPGPRSDRWRYLLLVMVVSFVCSSFSASSEDL